MGTAVPARRVAVIGAGWAGLAAAVEMKRLGHAVVLSDMAPQPGGRARALVRADPDEPIWDNGQHILIGAYSATLGLMRQLCVPIDEHLWRGPLALRYPDGQGLSLPAGPAASAFARGVWTATGWTWRDKLALLRTVATWAVRGFGCAAPSTVADLCGMLPDAVRRDLIEPLCVAALNTPAAQASGQVFLRVLRDAVFSGRSGADLLLPRVPLSDLLPLPAQRWLSQPGAAGQYPATCRWGQRTQTIEPAGERWQVDGELFDAVVLAVPASQAGQLCAVLAPTWSQAAAALEYQPILTVYMRDTALRLSQPMTALRTGPDAPAQFAFDLGQLQRADGHFAFVVSGASECLADGVQAAAQQVLMQARQAFAGAFAAPDALRHAAAERRATFACTPGLPRPGRDIAPGLVAAGDYVAGPYPATLEGAVRSGLAAAQAIHRSGLVVQCKNSPY